LHQLAKTDMMKQNSFWLLAVAVAVSLSSCEVVGGIFKAGMWFGIIIIAAIIILILWLVGRGRR
jgi:hypothetical protein